MYIFPNIPISPASPTMPSEKEGSRVLSGSGVAASTLPDPNRDVQMPQRAGEGEASSSAMRWGAGVGGGVGVVEWGGAWGWVVVGVGSAQTVILRCSKYYSLLIII